MESVWLKEDSDSKRKKKRMTHSEMITSTNLMIVISVKVSKHKVKLLNISEGAENGKSDGNNGCPKVDMSSSTKLQIGYL